ncbi:MAG: alpha/beta fold hydrolase [Vulcanimicrobiaceae bacterium]
MRDDDLRTFEREGAAPLPAAALQGYVEHEGARIWYASFGAGAPVMLLHGAFENGEDWGYQVGSLIAAGFRAVLVDSRGRGRSTRGSQPLGYELMAGEVLAVMDALGLETTALVGWSDGAIVGLILAMRHPARVTRVFAFGCNMDFGGLKELEPNPVLARAFARAKADYARLSPAPGEFAELADALNQLMKTEPNYRADELAAIGLPVAIVAGELDEFIAREHSEYLARTIPGAQLIVLPAVSHFAMLQRPAEFNRALLAFLGSAPSP